MQSQRGFVFNDCNAIVGEVAPNLADPYDSNLVKVREATLPDINTFVLSNMSMARTLQVGICNFLI